MNRCAWVAAALVAMSGCGGGLLQSDGPPERIYTLRAAPSSPLHGAEPLDVRLSVARPRVAPGLASERIAVRTGQHELDYYEGARWGDGAAVVVQSFLVDSLRQSGAFALVSSQAAPVAANYLLDLELRDFQAEQEGDAAPVARVAFVATLIEIGSRRALASFDVVAEAPAAVNRLSAVVDAIERAAHEAATELTRRLENALRQSGAAPT